MKTDFKDVSFLIPVKIDSIIRLENVLLTTNFLLAHFDTNIYVLEVSSYSNGILKSLLSEEVIYNFAQKDDPIFHKTWCLNKLSKMVNTNIISIWDADVLIPAAQLIDSVSAIRSQKYDVAYPYDGEFLDTSFIIRKHYCIYKNIDFLITNREKMKSIYSFKGIIGAVGGAVFVNREQYLYAGMENENFYGWGLEDGERHYRWLGLGLKIYRSSGCLFHLSHPRDINGTFYSNDQKIRAYHYLNETGNCTKEELLKNINRRNLY